MSSNASEQHDTVSVQAVNDSSLVGTNGYDDDGICSYKNVYSNFRLVKLAIMIIALIITMITVVTIVSHRQLRKKHNIFPFNIILADMLFIIVHYFWGGPTFNLATKVTCNYFLLK